MSEAFTPTAVQQFWRETLRAIVSTPTALSDTRPQTKAPTPKITSESHTRPLQSEGENAAKVSVLSFSTLHRCPQECSARPLRDQLALFFLGNTAQNQYYYSVRVQNFVFLSFPTICLFLSVAFIAMMDNLLLCLTRFANLHIFFFFGEV